MTRVVGVTRQTEATFGTVDAGCLPERCELADWVLDEVHLWVVGVARKTCATWRFVNSAWHCCLPAI
jgi:hypothetical protein